MTQRDPESSQVDEQANVDWTDETTARMRDEDEKTRGASDVLVAVAAVSATPFLQAVATHFGNRLAGTIDESTRAAFRRFLRRDVAELPDGDEAAPGLGPIVLTTDRGWIVKLELDTPPEAMAQLQRIQHGPDPELELASFPTPQLAWRDSAWRLRGVHGGVIVEWSWDTEGATWA